MNKYLYGAWLGALAAFLLGALDVATASTEAGLSWLHVLAGAAAAAVLGAFGGALTTGLITVLSMLRRWPLLRRLQPEPAEHSEWLVRVHAEVLAGLVAFGFGLVVFLLSRPILAGIQEEGTRQLLLLAVVAGCFFALLVVSKLLTPLLRLLFLRVQATFGLPLPKAVELRYALFVALPVVASMGVVLWRFGLGLGLFNLCLAVPLLVALGGQFHFGLLRGANRWRQFSRRAWVQWPLLALSLGMVSLGLWSLNAEAKTVTQSSRAGIAQSSTALLARVTDVDADGASALFGGADCAAFSGARFPGARDLPGNGVDEDCDGKDTPATASQEVKLATFHGALPGGVQAQRNVVWVVVDSLRADHLSLYGYEQETTPFLQTLAPELWIFTQAFSQASNTSLSMPSLFSGLDPGSFDWRQGPHYPLPKRHPRYVQTLLKEAGYFTAITLNSRVDERIVAVKEGYEEVLVTPKEADWNSADYALSNAMFAIDKARDQGKPFMLTVFIDGVHSPYSGGKGRALPEFKHKQAEITNYDRGIAGFDHAMRTLVTHLKNQSLWDNTVFVVTADHGEEFLEHGEKLHSTSCHVESTNVPLLLHVPGTTPSKVSTRVALVDVAPTVLEVLGLQSKAPELDGQSLFLPMLAQDRVTPDRPVFCTIYQVFSRKKDFFIRSVRRDNYALMHEFLEGKSKFYDTAADSKELHDLAGDATHAERIASLLELIKASKKSNIFETRTLK